MVTSPTARFTIDVEGTTKTLLSLRPSKKGDLFIILKTAPNFVEKDSFVGSSREGKLIVEQRYSIHPSTNLEEKNVIKQTLVVEGSEPIRLYHHTKAIKNKGRFALLFIRRAPDLTSDRYDLTTRSNQDISIGEYCPNRFTLFYAVAIGSAGYEFVVPELPGPRFDRITQADIGEYRIVVISSFLNRPSLGTGDLRHLQTISPDVMIPDRIRAISESSENGGEAAAIWAASFLNFKALAEAMINEIISELGDDYRKKLVDSAPLDFYPDGLRDGFSWLWMRISYINRVYNENFLGRVSERY